MTDSTPGNAVPCPQGRTDYGACFAPFRYCPVKGCGRALPTPEPDVHEEVTLAAVGLAQAWERFWAAVRAVEASNRG